MLRPIRSLRPRPHAPAAVTLALALLVSPLAARGADAATPERIVFSRSGAKPGLYSVSPSGTDLERLTRREDAAPVWSPRGTRIAFARWQEEKRRYLLFVARADGSDDHRIGTNVSASPAGIAWSPDGTRIAYQTYPTNRTRAVVVVTLATGDGAVIADAFLPAWSPDGDRLAFSAPHPDHPDCGQEVFTSDPDGSDRDQVTDAAFADDGSPAWSPDGKTIAFLSTRDHDMDDDPARCDEVAGDHHAAEVYVAPATGGPASRLTKGFTYKFTPAWSPDGSRIAYATACSIDLCDGSGYPQHSEIAVVSADGERERDLTDTRTWAEQPPVWSPDGSALVYGAANSKGARIEKVNVRTRKRTLLMDTPAWESSPDWRA